MNLPRSSIGGGAVPAKRTLSSQFSSSRRPGLSDNLIVGNTLVNNGTTAGAFGPGAGVVLASFVPGGAVNNNTVTGNNIVGSGLAGVTLHSHLPGQNLNGNVIASNNIGTNNLLGDFADTATTGVYVGSVNPLTIIVIGNRIHDNHNGISAAGPITIVRTNANVFVHVNVRLATAPTFSG